MEFSSASVFGLAARESGSRVEAFSTIRPACTTATLLALLAWLLVFACLRIIHADALLSAWVRDLELLKQLDIPDPSFASVHLQVRTR